MKLKNDFYKTNVGNLFLKCFLNNWNFLKVISKPGFVYWNILQENWFETIRPVLDIIFYIYALNAILDVSKCQVPYCRWRVHKLSLIGLS